MIGKFIILILDGFGVGYMDDAIKVRPQDVGSNTCVHILQEKKNIYLKNLEKLGLMNIVDEETSTMKKSNSAIFGSCNLTHFGADTFWGHQEIMGSKPLMPKMEPFCNRVNVIRDELIKYGYNIKEIIRDDRKLLMVNNALTIGDNIETDLGQAYNVTAALDLIDFQEVVKIGRIVREQVNVSRVIVFGGHDVSKEDIINAIEIKEDKYIGVNAPKSGVYKNKYHCVHLGYKVDYKKQLPYVLHKINIGTTLIGKVADIVDNRYGKSIPAVDTEEVMKRTINEIQNNDSGLICVNVQETDLSGHEQDVEKYSNKLKIVDKYLSNVIELLNKDDILIVMADHGNDPTIGHSKHTRERVPLMIYKAVNEYNNIGIRDTLSDVAGTVCEYFNATGIENGKSFLNKILN